MMNSRLLALLLLEVLLLPTVDGFRSRGPEQHSKVNSNQHQQQKQQQPIFGHQGRRHQLQQSAAAEDHARAMNIRPSSKFKNFDEVLATYSEEPLMVIFTAVNCGPCKLMKREMNEVNTLIGGRFKMFAVDTEKFPHVGSRFEIAALPCLILVQNGEPILRIEGVLKAEEVIERLRTIASL